MRVREMIERLKLDGTTLIGIFHDLEFMDGLCDKVFDLQKKIVGLNKHKEECLHDEGGFTYSFPLF